MKRVLIVVGTRPNFIKVTRFKQVAAQRGTLDVRIVHTGQHFSANMADVFFEQFGLVPDRFLNIGAGSPNTQMAQVMLGLEAVIAEEISLIFGYADVVAAPVAAVNGTMATVESTPAPLRAAANG